MWERGWWEDGRNVALPTKRVIYLRKCIMLNCSCFLLFKHNTALTQFELQESMTQLFEHWAGRRRKHHWSCTQFWCCNSPYCFNSPSLIRSIETNFLNEIMMLIWIYSQHRWGFVRQISQSWISFQLNWGFSVTYCWQLQIEFLETVNLFLGMDCWTFHPADKVF